MSGIGFIVLMIFAWFFYNLLVKVILPVYKATRTIKKQFRNMSEQQRQPDSNDYTEQQQSQQTKPQKTGEYIEFEEVK